MKKDKPQTGKVTKILFFLDSLHAGGKERQAVELFKQLSANKDFKLELILMKKGIHYKEVNNLNIKINYLFRKNTFDISVFFKLFKIVKRSKPDILHAWSTITALYAGPVTGLLKIKNICGSVRGATNVNTKFKSRLINKIGFLFADKIIANSNAGILSRNLKNNKKAICIHNGFAFSRLENLEEPENIKNKFALKTGKIIGMVGSLDERKDNEIFIDAAQQVIKKRHDVTFLIIGEGPKLEYLQTLVEKKNRDHIIFTGRQEGIEAIVNAFEIGVLTSKNEFFREGISNSIMEYMALAKPVIASDSGGNSEIVEDKITGFLVKPKDRAHLVKKLNYLLDNPKVAEKMGKAGKVRLAKEFSIEKMTNSYVELYCNLVRSNRHN
jgi:glycosyltransferase involved in cell wall biosynthesis